MKTVITSIIEGIGSNQIVHVWEGVIMVVTVISFREERANEFWFCSHLQPLSRAATWQPLVIQASTLQHVHFEFFM